MGPSHELLSSSPEALAWIPWPSESSYPLQDGGGQFLCQLFLVVPQVAGLILFVLWKKENGGDMGLIVTVAWQLQRGHT